jgi:hypothetical protein
MSSLDGIARADGVAACPRLVGCKQVCIDIVPIGDLHECLGSNSALPGAQAPAAQHARTSSRVVALCRPRCDVPCRWLLRTPVRSDGTTSPLVGSRRCASRVVDGPVGGCTIRLSKCGVAERQLDGGIANAGRVVRVGPHVLRPSTPHSGSIHAFLRAVRHAGFEGASSPVGIDEDGRERLVFIDGEVPVAPYPDWSQSDTALASIARLLRGLHDAARGFDPQGLTWHDALADPAGGTLVCHNDVEPSNVVFRDGIAVALLDFEFAAPGRPVYDVAQLARLCVPIDDDFDQARLGWRPADRPARLRLVADAYGLDRDGRADLLAAMNDAIDVIEAAVRRPVDAGDPNAVATLKTTGGMEKYDRRRRWWTDHHDRFAAALL